MTYGISPKVGAAGATGALTVLIVFVAGLFGVEVPAEAAAALTTLLATVAGYRADPGEVVINRGPASDDLLYIPHGLRE